MHRRHTVGNARTVLPRHVDTFGITRTLAQRSPDARISRSPHREAIKHRLERPFSPRRGAEQRAVVAALHRTIGDA